MCLITCYLTLMTSMSQKDSENMEKVCKTEYICNKYQQPDVLGEAFVGLR